MTATIIRERNGGDAVIVKYRFRCLKCPNEAIAKHARHPTGWAALEVRMVCRTTGKLYMGKFGDLCPRHASEARQQVPADGWRRVGCGDVTKGPD